MAVVVIQTTIQPTTGLRDLTDVQTFEHLTLDDVRELAEQRKRAKEQADKHNDEKKAMLEYDFTTKSYRNLGYIYFRSWKSLYGYLDNLLLNNTRLGVQSFDINYGHSVGEIVAGDIVIRIEREEQKGSVQVHISTIVNDVGTLATLQVTGKPTSICIESVLNDFAILARDYRCTR